MTKPHKHATLIKQWADDLSQKVWCWCSSSGSWREYDAHRHPFCESYQFALGPKPTQPPRKMCVLAGVEFPAPETRAPAPHTTYYFPAVSSGQPVGASEWAYEDSWGSQRHQLENGLVHLTREAAQQHSKALLAANKRAVEGAI